MMQFAVLDLPGAASWICWTQAQPWPPDFPKLCRMWAAGSSHLTGQLSVLFAGTNVSSDMCQLERQHLYSGSSKSCFLCFVVRSPSWPQPCAAEKDFFFLASISPVKNTGCQTALKPILKPVLGRNPKIYQQVGPKGVQQGWTLPGGAMRKGQHCSSGVGMLWNVWNAQAGISWAFAHSQSNDTRWFWPFPLCFACPPRTPSSLYSPSPSFPAACGKNLSKSLEVALSAMV